MLRDIDSGVSSAWVSSFADDTRVLAGVSTVEGVVALQEDLEKIYQWAAQNNATFNSTKFECLRYGRNKSLINSSKYYSNTLTEIESKPSVRDLGVTMSADGSFADQISNVTTSANLKCWWILRSFITRDRMPLVTQWKSLVQPILEYCCQLWCPNSPGLIQKLEKVQLNYFRKISGMSDLDYWDQLKRLNMYSLQRRRERYIVIYVWKILEAKVPNFGIEAVASSRSGRYCRVPLLKTTAASSTRTIRFRSMGVNGLRLFNAVPQHIRNMSNCSVETFKGALDKYLKQVTDEPRVPGLIKYCSRGSNSSVDQ